MKNLGKLFTVLLGAMAVMAFASCSSPSSGSSGPKIHKMEFSLHYQPGEGNPYEWEKTIYLKESGTNQGYIVYDGFEDSACTVRVKDKNGVELSSENFGFAAIDYEFSSGVINIMANGFDHTIFYKIENGKKLYSFCIDSLGNLVSADYFKIDGQAFEVEEK